MIVNQLNLHFVPFGPARVHTLEHFSPILTFGAAGTCVDFDIGVVGVGFARQECGDLIGFGTRGEFTQAGDGFVGQCGVAFFLRQFEQLDGIVAFPLNGFGGVDRLFQTTAFAHDFLRGLGVIPKGLILNLRIQVFKPLHGTIPIKKAAQQGDGLIDLIDVGLRFSAHFNSPILTVQGLRKKRG